MKFLHTNTSGNYQYPMGRALPPGEAIELDSDQCPEFAPDNGKKKPAAKKEPAPDAADIQLKEFLKGKADDIVKQLADATPEAVKIADLDRLEALEGAAAKPRKSVLEALAETKLRLAAAAQS